MKIIVTLFLGLGISSLSVAQYYTSVIAGQSKTVVWYSSCTMPNAANETGVSAAGIITPSGQGLTQKVTPLNVTPFNANVTQVINTTTSTLNQIYTVPHTETGPTCGQWNGATYLTVVPAIVPSVTGDLWWFGGETPQNYPTKQTLTSNGAGPWTWKILYGTEAVAFSNGAATITTTLPSTIINTIGKGTNLNDVRVQVSVNNIASAYITFKVRSPSYLVPIPGFYSTRPDGLYGYQSQIYYSIVDQYDQQLPATSATYIPVSEKFTSAFVYDYKGANWRNQDAGGALAPTNFMSDQIQGEALTIIPAPVPTPLPPAAGTVKVQHWSGEWRVGSVEPGKGVRVQKNTWQKYQDHALHTKVISPAP